MPRLGLLCTDDTRSHVHADRVPMPRMATQVDNGLYTDYLHGAANPARAAIVVAILNE